MEELKCLLEKLDRSCEKQSEHTIYDHINSVTKDDKSLEATAERMAFAFYENHESGDTGWGTYYGPMITWTKEDGEAYEYPGLSLVTEDILNYWTERAVATPNWLMKSRYNGLVWDFSNKVLGKKPDHKTAISYVQSLVAICDLGVCERPTESIQKITRAYRVAKSLNNEDLIKTCIESAIRLEGCIGKDDKPNLWGFCFKLFILEKRNHLTDEQKEKLVSDQEKYLGCTYKDHSPWACESVGIPLATYYRSIDDSEEVRRVVEVVGGCFESACDGLAAMQASSWLQHVHGIYISFNLHDKAESVSKKISEIGPDVVESMQSFSLSRDIPKEKLDSYLDAMTEGGEELSLNRIAVQFIQKKGQIERQVLELARDHPLIYLIPKSLHDHKGRPVATIGSIEDDLEGNTIHQLSQNLQINSVFLRHSIHKVIERYNISCDGLLDFIFKSLIFEDTKKNIVRTGISAFLEEEYYSSIHLLIPQIEAAIRSLVELMGEAILRRSRQGGLQLRTLDDLLREECVENCFGIDSTFYFRVLLTDKRGWNMRNDVCHGISPSSAFNCFMADRVLHVLLCLARVRKSHA